MSNKPEKVEVLHFRHKDKPVLKGYFTLVVYPGAQKILDCSYFVKDGRAWIAFPQKEMKTADGAPKEYISLVSYGDKVYKDALVEMAVEAIRKYKPQEQYGQEGKSYSGNANQLHANASSDNTELPF
jgi:hypothetical protein